jgi:chromosome segregation ATPase
VSWVKDLVDLARSVATLTKDVERTTAEIKELRRDVKELSLGLNELMLQLKHEKEKTAITLDSYSREITHIKEGNAARFEVLTAVLDQKIDGFESRLKGQQSKLRPGPRKGLPAKTSKKSET